MKLIKTLILLLVTCWAPQSVIAQNSVSFRKVTTAPTVQATNITFTEVSDESLRISAGRGNGLNVLIVGRLTSSTLTQPSSNTSYTASSTFGAGSQIGTGNWVLFIGQVVDEVLIDGLTENTNYTFTAYEFNASSPGHEKYNKATSTGNPASQTTLENIVAPTVQASTITWTGDRRISCTNGNGLRRIFVVHEGAAVDSNPVDGITYTASINFGEGSEIGTGNFVVYDGTDNFVEINPLTFEWSTVYHVRVFEYNISAGEELYYTATATGNPLNHTTISDEIWILYQDTILTPRKIPFNLITYSRASTQNYPTVQSENSNYYNVYSISEGEDGQDRTIRKRKSKIDGLPITQGWSYDGVDENGDPIAILDGTNQNYDPWSSGTTYNDNDVIRRTPDIGSLYQSLGNNNVGHTPWVNRTAGSFVVGVTYKIVSVGTTNFVAIGASSNTVGVEFVATGAGSGTGTATAWQQVTFTWDQYQCWAMWEVDLGSGNRRLYYVANSAVATRYSIGFLESSDDGETWSRYASNPVVASGSGKSYYYCHGLKDGSDWWMLVQNYDPNGLVEGHLYVNEIHHSTDGIVWTKTSTGDIFAGRGLSGAIDVSQPWKDGSKYYAYISYHDPGVTGGYQSNANGIKTTNPVGKHIALISWTDWNSFEDFIFERIIFSATQFADIDARTWCAPLVHNGHKFVWHMSFTWNCQTLLGSYQNEPYNAGKILTTDSILTEGYQFIGKEAYPPYVYRLILPHQNWLNDSVNVSGNLQPIEVISGRNLTVTGSPKIGRMRGVEPNEAGFIQDTLTYNGTYLSVKTTVDRNNLTTNYGLVGQDTDVVGGTRGWRITHSSQGHFDFFIYGSNSTYKQYRVNSASFIPLNSSVLIQVGFTFRNGDFAVGVGLCPDVEECDASKLTKIHDDSFTTIQQTDEPIRIGAVFPVTNDPLYSNAVVGAVLIMTGSEYATKMNWLLNEFL